MAQSVGRGIALLFHDCDTKRRWVVSSTPRPHFTPGKDLVPIVQEAGWASGPVWTGGKSRPHRDSIPDRPAHSQSLYRLSYPTHYIYKYKRRLCDIENILKYSIDIPLTIIFRLKWNNVPFISWRKSVEKPSLCLWISLACFSYSESYWNNTYSPYVSFLKTTNDPML